MVSVSSLYCKSWKLLSFPVLNEFLETDIAMLVSLQKSQAGYLSLLSKPVAKFLWDLIRESSWDYIAEEHCHCFSCSISEIKSLLLLLWTLLCTWWCSDGVAFRLSPCQSVQSHFPFLCLCVGGTPTCACMHTL